MSEDYKEFELKHDTLKLDCSDNYTCHTWNVDTAQVIVCTYDGDILMTNYEGEYLNCLPDSAESPRKGQHIFAAQTIGHGLIVAG